RFGEIDGVLYRNVVAEMPAVGLEREAFDQVLLLARRHAEADALGVPRKASGVDDENAAFPMTDRMPLQTRLEIRRMSLVDMNHALRVEPIDVEHDGRRIDLHRACNGIDHQHRRPGRYTLGMSRAIGSPCRLELASTAFSQRPRRYDAVERVEIGDRRKPDSFDARRERRARGADARRRDVQRQYRAIHASDVEPKNG